MNRIGVVLGVATFGVAALAAEFTWQGDESSSWQDEASYVEPGKPSAGDTVIFKDSAKATVTDLDFDFVSGLKWVYLKKASTITFDVTGDRQLKSCVRCYTGSRTEGNALVKKGAGTLELAGRSVEKNANASDYRINLDVQEGTLMMPQDPEITGYSEILSLNVAEGATFYTAYGAMTYVSGQNLSGGGLITNANPTAYAVDKAPVMQLNSVRGTFAGTIAGNILFEVGSSSSKGYDRIRLDGTDSTYLGQTYLYGSTTLWVKKFGLAGEPSSIGSAGRIEFAQAGGTVIYTGTEGETTDTAIRFDHNAAPLTLDGGDFGGVTFTGPMSYQSWARADHAVCLAGSNTEHECVFAGSFSEPTSKTGSYDYGTTFIKRGPGIWRFADNAARRNRGLIAVEEGTLRFDSIAEAASVCSLGLAQYWRDPDMTVAIESKEAYPFAILLGGGATEGVFEYTGSADATCLTRPIAVKGNARIRNASDGNFHWKNVFGWGDEAKTLTLDGGAGTENELENVTNACGVLSVAKDGAGTWTLDGAIPNGTVEVKAGTLVVRRKQLAPTWYRLTVKQNYMELIGKQAFDDADLSRNYGASNSRHFMIEEFALYDADGNRLNKNFVYKKDDDSARYLPITKLQPGEIGQDRGQLNNTSRTPDHLCDGRAYGDGWHGVSQLDLLGDTDYLRPVLPRTWVSVVMRLPANSPLVARYDYANYDCRDSGLTARARQVSAYTLEASANGEDWIEVTNVVGAAENVTAKRWLSDDSALSNNARPGCGFPIDTRLYQVSSSFEKVTSVSVASGATLKADILDGGTLTIKGLTIDPAKGAGTIDGFAFAETGTFNLTSLPSGGSKYKFTLTNCTGFENVADWNVRLDGQETGKYEIGVSEDGTVTIYRKGALVIIR